MSPQPPNAPMHIQPPMTTIATHIDSLHQLAWNLQRRQLRLQGSTVGRSRLSHGHRQRVMATVGPALRCKPRCRMERRVGGAGRRKRGRAKGRPGMWAICCTSHGYTRMLFPPFWHISSIASLSPKQGGSGRRGDVRSPSCT